MTLAAKIAAATSGVGGVGLFGCYAGGVFNSKTEIPWSSLSKDANFKATYTDTNTVGRKYGQYLTSANANKEWWEESFKQYQIAAKNWKPEERAITAAYSSSNDKALNKICEKAYKTSATADVKLNTGETVAQDVLSISMLKYCSPLRKIPEAIPNNESSYKDNTIGKQGYEKNLVSVTNKSNDGFWKAQQEWFKDQVKSPNKLDAYFGKFFEGNTGSKTLKEGKDIKTICAEAYKKEANNSSTSEKPKIDDVVKYCSFTKLA